jgi:5-methylcytosine-specific restriction endonuclease McrA
MSVINSPVLVLNQDYEPLNICRVRRAMVLLLRGKAEVLENGRGEIHAVSVSLPIPLQKKLTRFEVFNRDRYTCQYCGREGRDLTLDHVLPRSRGGTHEWGNVVSCCFPCNLRKAGRTPTEASMKLMRHPSPPPPATFSVPYQHLRIHDEWQKFIMQAG